MITLIVILLGYISYTRIPIDLLPDVTFPALTVRTNYPNVGAEEIENTITRPIEEAMAAIADVDNIVSVSSEGSSRVTINFSWGKNLESAAADVRERLDRIKARLPEDAETPILFKFDLSAIPILFLGVESDLPINDLQEFIEDRIKYRFERIAGVASIDIRGGYKKQVKILLNKTKCEQLNIPLSKIVASLKINNTNQTGGSIIEGNQEIIFRANNEFKNIEDIKNRVVTVFQGQPILVKDIAEVEFSIERVRQKTIINSKPGVRIAISKQSGSNTVEVADRVKQEISKINADYSNLKIFPLTDTSLFIKNSIDSLKTSVIYGAALAILILLFFLRNIRSTIIISIAIPISIIATFILVYSYGYTLNIISFGGLALGIGMLVDNSIVVLENIFRHLTTNNNISRKQAALIGASEVSSAIIASTLTTIAVFLPMLFISGFSGIMFKQIAWVVTFSLICSLVVSLTLTPMLCSKFLKHSKTDKNKEKNNILKTISAKFFEFSELFFVKLENSYSNIIDYALKNKKTILFAVLMIIILSIYMSRAIGTEFMPQTDEGEIRITIEAQVGANLQILEDRTLLAQKIALAEVKEMESILTSIGDAGGMPGASSSSNTSSIRIKLKDKKFRKRSAQEIIANLNKKLSSVQGVVCRSRAAASLGIFNRLAGEGDKITVEIRGHNLKAAQKIGADLLKKIEKINGITDARLSRDVGRPEKIFEFDYYKIAKLGLSINDLNDFINIGLAGKTATYYRIAGKEYNVLVQFKNPENYSVAEILQLKIPLPNNNLTSLGNLVLLKDSEGPLSIDRLDQERVLTISANYQNRDLGAIISDLQTLLKSTQTPQDITLRIGGEYEQQQKSFKEMMFVLLLAVLLVYMIMAAQFESIIDPLIIILSVPLAAFGVILIFILTDTLFNIQAFIGVIMLAGIVVNNAIILVDYTNQLIREHSYKPSAAIIEAGKRRLRPILMTTLTTVLGLLPLAIGIGEGSEMQVPLARAVCGGLLSSTLITLVFIPVVLDLKEKLLKTKK